MQHQGDASAYGSRVTIKEVARAAGVSRSTASRAMGASGYVAAEVRIRVQQAARDLGYVVDATARSLKQQSSRLIGVVVSDLQNPFYAALAAGASRTCRAHGYTMVLIDDRGATDDQNSAAEQFVALRVAGVVGTAVSDALVHFLSRRGVPVVEVDRRFAPELASGVVIDNHEAARLATEHLVTLGHTRIALFIAETLWSPGAGRLDGYRAALATGGISADDDLVVRAGWDVDAGVDAARSLLTGPHRPTAIFAANNLLAEGVWRAAAELGMSVPDDLSLIAFDDAPWMSMVTPGVTAIVQDADALGAAGVETLIARIAAPTASVGAVVLATHIRHRGSTAAPRVPAA